MPKMQLTVTHHAKIVHLALQEILPPAPSLVCLAELYILLGFIKFEAFF